jgi:uncharacterized protein YjbJ (UPF0337 family)
MLLLFPRDSKSGLTPDAVPARLSSRDESKSYRFARTTKESSQQFNWEVHMNWDQIEGKWKEMKGQLREKWGNLTDDDLEMIAGRRDQLIGRLQIRYGFAKEEAAKQVDEFANSLNPKVKEMKRVAHQT